MQPLNIDASKIFAILLGCVSVLFLGQLIIFLAIKSNSGINLSSINCVLPIAMLPLLVGTMLWKRQRLMFFFGIYCFGLAASMALYFCVLAIPTLFPDVMDQMSPKNREWMSSIKIHWIAPLSTIIGIVMAGFGILAIDRHDAATSNRR